MEKIYLAGKISQNDWRGAFFEHRWDLRDAEPPIDLMINRGIIKHRGDLIAYPETENSIFTKYGHQYTGPFFLSCDHGCYHGPSTHALGANNYDFENDPDGGHRRPMAGCGTFDGWNRQNIVTKCGEWIRAADIIFAWINSKDCFGTLAEIGYANALNKKIWVVYSDELWGLKLEWPTNIIPEDHDMWFIDHMADKVAISMDPLTVYKKWSGV